MNASLIVNTHQIYKQYSLTVSTDYSNWSEIKTIY